MNVTYLPEGRLLNTPENRRAVAGIEALTAAMERGLIVEGTALRCTPEHDLLVALGPFTGVIPRLEAAAGVAQGAVREVAILSRVGRPVCCVVTGLDIDPGGEVRPILSRRLAQERALDYFLSHLSPGDILPATVTHLKSFGAFVDMGCGVISLIGIDRISVSRIGHASLRFVPGQEIFAAVLSVDRAARRFSLTHRELLGTWAENAARFSPGDTVPGFIRGVQDYGLFVELTPNLSGLAEPREDMVPGARVCTHIKSIFPDRMKIKLLIVDTLPPLGRPEPPRYVLTHGHLSQWRYAPPGCAKAGAFTQFDPEPSISGVPDRP